MALWLDKHRPKKLSKLDFHKKQAEHLEKLVKSGDFPHLLVSIAYENYKINTNKILLLRVCVYPFIFYRFFRLLGRTTC